MHRRSLIPTALLLTSLLAGLLLPGTFPTAQAAASGLDQPGIIRSEDVADPLPTPYNHSSTVIDTKDGLLVAWAGGLQSRATDVSIYTARWSHGAWTRPDVVADGIQPGTYRRYPAWNPVLFQPKDGPLHLYYKIGPSPESWWGVLRTSVDQGRTWSEPRTLGHNLLGPVRNKPVQLRDGTILAGSSTENSGWRVHMERQTGPKGPWHSIGPINSALEYGAIQPTILPHRSGRVQILCRSKSGHIVESWSNNQGLTWSPLRMTTLPNPNGALDAVMTMEGMALLVYNHSTEDRSALHVATSTDGKHWLAALTLENEPGHEYAYPAVIQASDGMIHITYSCDRQRIRHVTVDPWQLKGREMPEGQWPR